MQIIVNLVYAKYPLLKYNIMTYTMISDDNFKQDSYNNILGIMYTYFIGLFVLPLTCQYVNANNFVRKMLTAADRSYSIRYIVYYIVILQSGTVSCVRVNIYMFTYIFRYELYLPTCTRKKKCF